MKIFHLLFCLCPLLSAFCVEETTVPAADRNSAAAADAAISATPESTTGQSAARPTDNIPTARPTSETAERPALPAVLTGSGGDSRPGLRHTWTGPGPSGYTPWYWWKIPPPWTPTFARNPWYWRQIPQPTPRGELTPAQAVASPLRPEKQDIPASVRLRGSRLPASRSLPAPADTPARIRLKQYQMPSSPSRPASVPRLRSTPGGLRRR